MDEKELLRKIIEAKDQARHNETRRNLIRLVVVVTATLIFTGWALQTTATCEDLYRIFMPVIPVALVIADLSMWLLNATVFPRHAECPNCGHSWETKSFGRVVSNRVLFNLESCPGCRVPIAGGRLRPDQQKDEIRGWMLRKSGQAYLD